MDFYKRVEAVCAMIPYGKAASYGQIALLCQMPDNARQVGYALSHRLLGERIPAHRIVNSKGVLSGAQAFEQPDTQKRRLESEGILVLEGNRVNMKIYGWKSTWDDALELAHLFEQKGI